ncbi:MAG TPA: dihydrodipicolinate reductase [Acidobacteriota bacterium]|nr:dihydrodipicolinate reductase [Acidobacteriota bacterium]
MAEKIRVVQYGLGPIGCLMARHVLERQSLELAGAVDVDPAKAGRDVGEIIGLGRQLGMPVRAKLQEVLADRKAEVVLHTTNSYFDLFKSQIVEILKAGLDVVSTSEELSFPWIAHPEPAVEIDNAAKKAGKTVLGTGVNPGFLMDTLPLSLTGICQRVDHLEVRREQNASKRRGPFQAKIGSGMTIEQFKAKMAEGRMGHVGLPESVGMIFHTLGKKLVHYEDSVEPVVADRVVKTEHFEVTAGRAIGLRQTACGYSDKGEFVRLVFVAALDHKADQDTVIVKGKPNLNLTLEGTHGDIATIAIAVNAVRRVHEAAPGLVTMRDLPLVTIW